MKQKALIMLLLICGLMAFAIGASAERYVTNGSYTAYIGDSDYTYLEDPTGVTKVLQTATKELLSMTDTHLYCLTMDGRLYDIDLAASSTSVISSAPTQEAIDAVTAKKPYTLENGSLSVTGGDGLPVVVATGVTLAGANTTNIYFLDNNGATLKSMPLDNIGGTSLVAATQIGPGSAGALSMSVTENGVVIVAADHSLIIVNLTNNAYSYEAAPSADVVLAQLVGTKLYYYTQDTDGVYHVAGRIDMTQDTLALTTTGAPTAAVTATPTPKPTATATPKRTATPKPKATSSSSSSSSSNIRYGSSGSSVKKMQKRLAELGYPVGSADGVFGDNTLYALNLFQGDVGYTERKYANSSTQTKLYSKSAPTYDPFRGLKKNDSGIRVTILQTYLSNAGYNPGEIDGVYGANTKSAVERFQLACGIPVTGEADKTTLILLYGASGPVYPVPVLPTTTPVPSWTPVTMPPITMPPITVPPAYTPIPTGGTSTITDLTP